MNALHHPGYHRRRDQRLQDEEDQRAFQRQLRAHGAALDKAISKPIAIDTAKKDALLAELVAAGRAVLTQLPYH